jgi:hypothetical protein
MYKRILFLLLIFILSISLGAAEHRSGNSISVREGDTVQTDLFTGARYLDVLGVVMGDVYAGCEVVSIDGEVMDDVLAGCRNLEIKGRVADGIIVFAETMLIDGQVDGDVLAFGKILRITERAHIKGNVFAGNGELRLEGGRIGGTLRGGVGKFYLNGHVGKYVELEAEDIAFGPDFNAKEGTRLTLPKELSEYEVTNQPENLEVTVKLRRAFYEKAFFYWSLLALLIVGVLIIAFFKDFSRDYLVHAREKLGLNLGYGFLSLVLTPIVIVILLILILTIPVSLILLAAYLILIYLSSVFAALYIGDYILSQFYKEERTNSLFLSLLIGVVLASFLPEIPFIGWLISLIIISFGMGSLLTYVWRLRQTSTTVKAD